MKLSEIGLFLALSGFVEAQNPFEDPKPEPDSRDTLIFEYIEIDRAEWESWRTNPENSLRGPELRERVQQLLADEKATVVDLAAISGELRRTGKTRSTREIIFASEFGGNPDLAKEGTATTQFSGSAFETREVGLKIEAEINGDELKFAPELTHWPDDIVLGWKGNEFRLPGFHSAYSASSITLPPGEIALVKSFTPHESADDREDPVILLFARRESHRFEEDPGLPVDTSPPLPARAADSTEPIIQARLVFEWIEVPLEKLRQLPGGPARRKVQELIDTGEAKIVETNTLPARSGQRAKVEAVTEQTYASEFDPVDFNDFGGAIPVSPGAFETRNVGFTIEVDPVLFPRRGIASISLNPEWVQFRGLRIWGEELGELDMPDFYTMRTTTSARIPIGASRLIGTHQLPEADRQGSRLLLFARVDMPGWAPREAADQAISLGTWLETWEVDKKQVSEWLAEGGVSGLRSACVENGAHIDSAFLLSSSGQRAKLQSVLELLYPSEYDPPEISKSGDFIAPNNPAAWERRDVGQTIVLDAAVKSCKRIEIALNAEFSGFLGMHDSQQAESSAPMPIFHQQQLQTNIRVSPGEFAFAGATQPPEPADPDRVWLWFVRSDIFTK